MGEREKQLAGAPADLLPKCPGPEHKTEARNSVRLTQWDDRNLASRAISCSLIRRKPVESWNQQWSWDQL